MLHAVIIERAVFEMSCQEVASVILECSVTLLAISKMAEGKDRASWTVCTEIQCCRSTITIFLVEVKYCFQERWNTEGGQ